MMSKKPGDISILNIHDVGYHCIINRISKNDAMSLLNNASVNKKKATL